MIFRIMRKIKSLCGSRCTAIREKEKEILCQHEIFMRTLSPDRGFVCSPKLFSPRYDEATETTDFDPDYTYHCAWAARKVLMLAPREHVDISSFLFFVGVLSAAIPVKFYDYRPPALSLSNLEVGFADITALPFADNSIETIFSLSVIEHIGLGRYGDPLDPDGDLKAIRELIRVVKPRGSILINVPVAQKAQVIFNAHRIYTKEQIVSLFTGCTLEEFFAAFRSPTEGTATLLNPENTTSLPNATGTYAGGCFHFRKSGVRND